jgi:hypothetical protein
VRKTSSGWRWIAPVLCLVAFPAMAEVGRVVVAQGGVIKRPGSDDISIQKNTVIRQGDTLSIPRAANAQIWMEDDSMYALARDTEFRVDEFAAPRAQGGAARSIMTLLKGGFRAVSGLISKQSGGVMEVRTTVATMGIRGTTWSAGICSRSKCKTRQGKPLKDGLYVKVDDGNVDVRNAGGTLTTPAGRVSFAASAQIKATFVDDFPEMFVDLDEAFEFEVESELEPDLLERIEPIDPISPSSPSTP